MFKTGDKVRLKPKQKFNTARAWLPKENLIYTVGKQGSTLFWLKEDPHGYSWSVDRFELYRPIRVRPLPD